MMACAVASQKLLLVAVRSTSPPLAVACTLFASPAPLHATRTLVSHWGSGLPTAVFRPTSCVPCLSTHTKLESKGVVVAVDDGVEDTDVVGLVVGELVRVVVRVDVGVVEVVGVLVREVEGVVVAVAVAVVVVVAVIVGDVVPVVVGDVASHRKDGFSRKASVMRFSVLTVLAQSLLPIIYLVNPHATLATAPAGPRKSCSSLLRAATVPLQSLSTTREENLVLASQLTGSSASAVHLPSTAFSTFAWVPQCSSGAITMLLTTSPEHWNAPVNGVVVSVLVGVVVVVSEVVPVVVRVVVADVVAVKVGVVVVVGDVVGVEVRLLVLDVVGVEVGVVVLEVVRVVESVVLGVVDLLVVNVVVLLDVRVVVGLVVVVGVVVALVVCVVLVVTVVVLLLVGDVEVVADVVRVVVGENIGVSVTEVVWVVVGDVETVVVLEVVLDVVLGTSNNTHVRT